jgi:hypothetical protein
MKAMACYLVVVLALIPLIGCVSSAQDSERAARVGRYLDAAGVIPIEEARDADKTHSGKIVYVGPGINGSPHFTYYEVTSPEDMQKLKVAAEDALRHIPDVNRITLHFMEKQVIHQSQGGGLSRGREKEINTVVVSRN